MESKKETIQTLLNGTWKGSDTDKENVQTFTIDGRNITDGSGDSFLFIFRQWKDEYPIWQVTSDYFPDYQLFITSVDEKSLSLVGYDEGETISVETNDLRLLNHSRIYQFYRCD